MTVTAEFTGNTLKGWKGEPREIRTSDGRRFVASEILSAPDHGGQEILVFEMPSEGDDPASWMDIAGGRGITFDQALADLVLTLNSEVE